MTSLSLGFGLRTSSMPTSRQAPAVQGLSVASSITISKFGEWGIPFVVNV